MKLKKYIYIIGVALVAFTSCNDYLDVDAPSAYTGEFVFTQSSEVERALNGVYAQALAGNLYGDAYQRTFIYNTDVDMMISSASSHAHDTYSRYDCDEQGSGIYKFWTAAYALIEYANKFIRNAEAYSASSADIDEDDLNQWIGEAKCLRAMAYHDLVVMFGDVPFTFEPASDKGTDFVIPVADRQDIQDMLITDLKEAGYYMRSSNSTTVERCSKEFAYALIARIALTAGGYSLQPDLNNKNSYGTMERPENYQVYYQTARDYADSVISMGTHSLVQDFDEVFIQECNYEVVNNGDPIFEIPFAKLSTGSTGYLQGPTYSAYESNTVGVWGACSGNARLNAFYRFLFRENDMRREEVNGMWYYSYYTSADGSLADSVYIRNDYTVHNNKWSKLWTSETNALGTDKTGSTGINYPYMRYADVLLMYAEAENELNGPTEDAVACLKAVHDRAFRYVAAGDDAFIDLAKTNKEAFQNAVMNERKWEFAGENSRWRDLVRTNKLGEVLVYSFLRYYSVGMQNAGSPSGYEDAINEYDGLTYIDEMPERIYFHAYRINVFDELAKLKKLTVRKQLYGYTIDADLKVVKKYPNQSQKSLRIYNAYKPNSQPTKSTLIGDAVSWNYADFYQWGNNDTGTPKDQCLYSFYGYIRGDDGGNIWLIKDGAMTLLPTTVPAASELPVVRYILPYPNLAIQRSAGEYKNYYGY